MNPLEFGKALADYWVAGGEALLSAQQKAFKETMSGAGLASMPDFSGAMTEVTRANNAFVDLWSESSALSAALTSNLPASGPAGATLEAIFRKTVDPGTWLAGSGSLDEALNRVAEGPRLADLWDIERRYARVMQAWLELRRRNLEHTTIVLNAWMQASRSFATDLAKLPSADRKTPDVKAMLALWIEIANKTLLDMERSDQFLATQRDSIRASIELRSAQRDLVEYYGERFGFPTRTELDEVHMTITELRRELRALTRERRNATRVTPTQHRASSAAKDSDSGG